MKAIGAARNALFGLALAASPLSFAAACGSGHPSQASAQDQRIYECPMHCKLPGHAEPYSQRGPGDCPVCHMHLVPRR